MIQAWAEEYSYPLTISRGGILHLNREYMYPGGDHDLVQLFAEHDLTENVAGFHDEVRQAFVEAAAIADNDTQPTIQPGDQCGTPYLCPFLGSACEPPPADELAVLPRIRATRRAQWHEAGIHTLDDLDPGAEGLNETQHRVWRSHTGGGLQVEPGLRAELARIGYPRYHLDFESTGSWMALPRWVNTRPF